MKKIFSKSLDKLYHYYPTTVCVVGASNGEKENLMSAIWHCPLSFDPPLYGVAIAPKRITHALILETKEFSLNFLPYEKAKIIAQVGGTHGSDINKFEKFKIKKEKAKLIISPILTEAYAAYECKLTDYPTVGDHTFFIGRIAGVHYFQKAFSKEGLIYLNKIKPALYIGADHYCFTDKSSVVHLPRS